MGFLPFALQLLSLAPSAAQGVMGIWGIMNWGEKLIRKRQAEGKTEPTPEDWKELNQRLSALTADLEDGP